MAPPEWRTGVTKGVTGDGSVFHRFPPIGDRSRASGVSGLSPSCGNLWKTDPSPHQRLLLFARPLLEFMLALERVRSRLARLRVHQAHRTAARRIPRAPAAVVHAHARPRIARVADVEGPVPAADDVDEMHRADTLPQPTDLRSDATP